MAAAIAANSGLCLSGASVACCAPGSIATIEAPPPREHDRRLAGAGTDLEHATTRAREHLVGDHIRIGSSHRVVQLRPRVEGHAPRIVDLAHRGDATLRAVQRALIWLAIAAASCRGLLGLEDPIVIDAASSGAAIDAPDALPADACASSAGPCAAKRGTCGAGRCVIMHPNTTAVTCPDNMPCVVTCLGVDGCDAGVRCGNASSCEVN